MCILLSTCSLTRAILPQVLPNQSTQEIIMALKRLIARRGRASVIYSGNEKAFVAASKWIIKIKNDEEMQEYLIQVQIKRKFNLSKAPWWEGQFERMIGLVKQSLFTAIGRTMLI